MSEAVVTSLSSDSSSAVKIVDAFAPAERLVTAGVASFSKTLLIAVSGQLEAPIAELAVLDKATSLAIEHYESIASDVRGAGEHLRAADALHAALAPHCAEIDALEIVIGELEIASRGLDVQTKQLEGIFSTLL